MIALLWVAVGLAACDTQVSAGRVERCALGVHADPEPSGDPAAALVAFEELVGRTVDIDRQYYLLSEPVPGDHERWVADGGRTPMFSVATEAPMTWARIADPDDVEASALVSALAGRLRDFDRPLYVLFHESKEEGELGSAADYAAAFRRLVEVSRAEGADQAMWVWSLGSGQFPTDADDWYPGDEWVDWLGASGFNWYTGDPVSNWRPFAAIFAPFREWADGRGKPLMITTVSTAENLGTPDDDARSKATWIREALATLEIAPDVQAFVWFHGAGEDEFRNWRVDSSAAALAAFRELAAAPHMDISGALPP